MLFYFVSLPSNAKKVFEGVMFDVYQWEQQQFDGTAKTFEAVQRKPSVQIIAITSNNKILLLKEEQPFVGSFISLPGGICETNNPENDAKRELLEETGRVCDVLFSWKKTEFSAKVLWDNYYFIAKNCKKVKDPCFDSGEKIVSFEVDFEEFIEIVLGCDFRNKEFAYMILKLIHEKNLECLKKELFD